MVTLAITGSSGAGKSFVSNLFLKFQGTYLIDTDKIAKDLAKPNSKYLNDIKDYFGEDFLLTDGNLNRKKMAQKISVDKDAQNKLNEITKMNLLPVVNGIIEKNKDKKLIIVDIPILFENKLEKDFDKILAVISNKEEQIKRICNRDKVEEKIANARISIQKNNEFFINNVDYIIENINKTEEELLEEIKNIYEDLEGK